MEPSAETKNYEDRFSDFIEAAAHDLQAPLRKLSVTIDRVFAKHAAEFDEDSKAYMQRAERCIREMQLLIDGLTELAKADTHVPVAGACDLNMIARDTLQTLAEEIEMNDCHVQLKPLPVVVGNEIQYKQLFKNILENAIKFRRKNASVNVELKSMNITDDEKKFHHLSAGKIYYRVEISDDGIGFDGNNADKIFEPFVRLHSKSEYPGNGLGLAICKKIVNSHNGIIYAEGDEKTGSRFILILPQTP